jgi:hypothetical protein
MWYLFCGIYSSFSKGGAPPRRGGGFLIFTKNPSPCGYSSSSLRLSEPNGLFQRENKSQTKNMRTLRNNSQGSGEEGGRVPTYKRTLLSRSR